MKRGDFRVSWRPDRLNRRRIACDCAREPIADINDALSSADNALRLRRAAEESEAKAIAAEKALEEAVAACAAQIPNAEQLHAEALAAREAATLAAQGVREKAKAAEMAFRSTTNALPAQDGTTSSDQSDEAAATIDPEQFLLRREIALIDSHLAMLRDRFPDFNHDYYSRNLIEAAVIGLDGSPDPVEARDASSAAYRPGRPGPVNIELANDCLDSMRIDLLLRLERRVKNDELIDLGVRCVSFMVLPWLLLVAFYPMRFKVFAHTTLSLLALVVVCYVLIVVDSILYNRKEVRARGPIAPEELATLGPSKAGPSLQSAATNAFLRRFRIPPGALLGSLKTWKRVYLVAGAMVSTWFVLVVPLQPEAVGLKRLLTYGIFWNAVMIGVWLAVGARFTRLSFAQLLTPTEDQFNRWVRLLRAGLYSVLLAIILAWLPKIEFMNLNSREIFCYPSTAFIFGCLFGLSELLLPAAAGIKAEGLFKAVNGNK